MKESTAEMHEDKERRKQQLKAESYVCTPTMLTMLKKMDELLSYPTRARMPCMRLIGAANSGKSSLLRQFAAKYPRYRCSKDYADKMPIVYLLIPDCTERGLFDAALTSMGANIPSSHSLGQKRIHFLKTCRELGVRMLVLDEFHDAGHGSGRQQAKYCASVKSITNDLRIPIIVAGTDEVKAFINSEPQLYSRFTYQLEITAWKNNMEYRAFLKALEKLYPLKRPSHLATNDTLAQKILDVTDGITGDMIHLLEFAAVDAIDSGKEQITVELIDSLVETGVWIRPSLRGP